ncbi:FAD-dependent monooxygenase [Nitrosomonas sp.]|uniref:FAD-dependent monooxygenase n=1 Tax=Nitrosomonas sp. TaxID=42353 RepID=UPI001D64C896|nr:FAD-dependent monooxygenase [Nitrosomonas sp.]MBX3617414.1 FAD-dependent monooxygenase [Nitrosomonas sp.]
MITDHYDVAIIGGGPVGMALALALRQTKISSILLEARGIPEKEEDPRPLALSYGSHLILERLGVWRDLSRTTAIKTIHISNRGVFGRTILTSSDADVPALGFVVNYHDLFCAMHQQLMTNKSDYIAGATVTRLETTRNLGEVLFTYQNEKRNISAKLIVLADGGQLAKQIPNLSYRIHDYQQWAIVANIQATQQQTGIAYERFTSDGPVALLPNADDFALVWTVSPTTVKEFIAMDDDTFLARLHQHFGDRLGKFVRAGKRSAFPLSLKYAPITTAQRVTLIGNAAQTLHPVAGQGFNLGLRDAYELAREIINASNRLQDIGSAAMLRSFYQNRKIDSSASRMFTDSLINIFSNNNRLLQQACGLGLSALDGIPSLKHFVARRMIFGVRG